jgi:hypothetical protein
VPHRKAAVHGSVHTKAVGTSEGEAFGAVVGTGEGEAFGAGSGFVTGAVVGAVAGAGSDSVAAIGVSTSIMVAGAAPNGSVAPCSDPDGSVAGERRWTSVEGLRDLSMTRSVEGARLRAEIGDRAEIGYRVEIGDLSMMHGSARLWATRAAEPAAAGAAGANAR